MISALGTRCARAFERSAPDPFVLAVLLTVLTAVLAFTLGDFPDLAEGGNRQIALLDSWRDGSDGIWKFLEFSMQMCLILVTGHALAASKPVEALIGMLARIPRSGAQAAAMIGLCAAGAGLINWGFGLIVGALLAREVGRSLARRQISAHYPLLAAAGYMGLLVWHGGYSGSAPLVVTTPEGAASVLPEAAVAALGEDGISLRQTILSNMNLFVSLGLLVIVPAVLWLLNPKDEADRRSIDDVANLRVGDVTERAEEAPTTIPEWLERTPPLAWILAALLLAATARFGRTDGFTRLGLNEINGLMLALGLVMHGSLASYARAVEDGARGCAGIMIQFPLYAGIMAMLDSSGLVARFSDLLAQGGQTGVPLLTFLSAGVVNFFVPSGGGQWGIQGPIALEAGVAAGVAPGKMVMAVAYGDQLTNMLQPFWALPLLAITGVRARDIVGYTAIVMVVAGAWMALGLLLF